MPLLIQRIQTDRGREFFAYKVQGWLRGFNIKFRPIRPRSPRLNGKVERGHNTDLQEFYATADLIDRDLQDRLDEWQHFYNRHRSHSSLGGKTPMETCNDLISKTPFWDDVVAQYDAESEPIRQQNFVIDQEMSKLK